MPKGTHARAGAEPAGPYTTTHHHDAGAPTPAVSCDGDALGVRADHAPTSAVSSDGDAPGVRADHAPTPAASSDDDDDAPRGRGVRARTRRAVRTLAIATVAAAVTAVAFAAFTDEAANRGNQATAATVTIAEDVPAATPLFDLVDWQPGEDSPASRCIAIRNDGSIALPLRLRFDGPPAGTLGDYVDRRIERGSRPPADDTTGCDTFVPDQTAPVVYDGELDEFPTMPADALPDGGGLLAPGAERAYRITWTLQDDENAEGRSVSGVTFLWETTSAD